MHCLNKDNDEIIETNYEAKKIKKGYFFSLQIDLHVHFEIKWLTKCVSNTWIYITHFIISSKHNICFIKMIYENYYLIHNFKSIYRIISQPPQTHVLLQMIMSKILKEKGILCA
jgi:hypothetical protein